MDNMLIDPTNIKKVYINKEKFIKKIEKRKFLWFNWNNIESYYFDTRCYTIDSDNIFRKPHIFIEFKNERFQEEMWFNSNEELEKTLQILKINNPNLIEI